MIVVDYLYIYCIIYIYGWLYCLNNYICIIGQGGLYIYYMVGALNNMSSMEMKLLKGYLGNHKTRYKLYSRKTEP